MANDPEDFAVIAASFSALMNLLENEQRSTDERRMFTDRMRDALDRRAGRLDTDVSFVANTFKLEAVTYAGERSEIWRLRHRDLASLHAIKTLPDALKDDPVARDLLLREGRIGMQLRHPNIVSAQTVLRLGDGRPALLMDWMDNSLETICRAGILQAEEVITAISATLAALAHLHDSGFAHGDVTPANLLVSTSVPDSWKLADFGITLEHGRRYAELDIGRAASPGFAAPEQQNGGEPTPASDIYATGRLIGFTLAHSRSDPALAERMSRVADLFCTNEPEERPADARAAAALFSEAIILN